MRPFRSGITAVLAFVLLAACGGQESAPAPQAAAPKTVQQPPLLPRALLFEPADRARGRISPDGKHLAVLAPRNGVFNVHVAPIDDLSALKPVTDDDHRGVVQYFWTWDSKAILYVQDKDGDENFHVYRVDLATLDVTDLTPLDGIRANLVAGSVERPGHIVVGINDRGDKSLHDVYEIELATGKRTLLQQNPGYIGFDVDHQHRVRTAYQQLPDGGMKVLKKADDGTFQDFLEIPAVDNTTTGLVGFTTDGRTAYLRDSRGRDTAALFALDMDSGEKTLLAEHPKADIEGSLIELTAHRMLAASARHARVEWQAVDEGFAGDLKVLRQVADGDLMFLNMTKDGRKMVVGFDRSDAPFEYYLYDRDQKKASFLMTLGSQWKGLPFAPMHPRVIKARDGLELVSYLTLPLESDPDGDGVPDAPVPMVLDVHGGPWARDGWGLSNSVQLFANRGYAVLNVNFRGSTGFGKAFTNAGDKEWGRKMHDDLIDAVEWAKKQGIADPDRIAIYGGSYGGYSVLAGLTFTPKVFACGVDIVGPSNLVTLLNTIPPYWKPMMDFWAQRVGDPRTEDGRKLLEERSPLNYIENIEKPLLIAQGANDPRVKQSESDQIVAAMQAKDIPVTYVLYADEGHGFARPESNKSFWAITEAFLGECLGGRVEPIGADFEGANFTVPAGAQFVPGLAAALDAPADAGDVSGDAGGDSGSGDASGS